MNDERKINEHMTTTTTESQVVVCYEQFVRMHLKSVELLDHKNVHVSHLGSMADSWDNSNISGGGAAAQKVSTRYEEKENEQKSDKTTHNNSQ